MFVIGVRETVDLESFVAHYNTVSVLRLEYNSFFTTMPSTDEDQQGGDWKSIICRHLVDNSGNIVEFVKRVKKNREMRKASYYDSFNNERKLISFFTSEENYHCSHLNEVNQSNLAKNIFKGLKTLVKVWSDCKRDPTTELASYKIEETFAANLTLHGSSGRRRRVSTKSVEKLADNLREHISFHSFIYIIKFINSLLEQYNEYRGYIVLCDSCDTGESLYQIVHVSFTINKGTWRYTIHGHSRLYRFNGGTKSFIVTDKNVPVQHIDDVNCCQWIRSFIYR